MKWIFKVKRRLYFYRSLLSILIFSIMYRLNTPFNIFPSTTEGNRIGVSITGRRRLHDVNLGERDESSEKLLDTTTTAHRSFWSVYWKILCIYKCALHGTTAGASAVVLLIYFSVCSFPSAFLIRDLTTDYKSGTSDDKQTIEREREREKERRDHLLLNRIFNSWVYIYIGENLSLSIAYFIFYRRYTLQSADTISLLIKFNSCKSCLQDCS